MSNELYLYGRPAGSTVTLQLDNGAVVTAPTVSANGREDAHCCPIPQGTMAQGAVATLACADRKSRAVRGIVTPSDTGPALMLFDDFGELEAADVQPAPGPEPPPAEGPPTPADAESVVRWVYETGYGVSNGHDLSTHDGCGMFTDACCRALHEYNAPTWGHDKRTPPQNSYEGHAVDAIQCIGGQYYGMWDIIKNSVSPDATWCFNLAGPPNPTNWFYPYTAVLQYQIVPAAPPLPETH